MADQGSEGLLSPFLRYKRFTAAKPFLLGDVLDVGCGIGLLAKAVPADSYLGVDTDTISLGIASAQNPVHSFQVNLPNDDQKFDTIVALAVIEHIKNPTEFLTTCAKYLKLGCSSKIIITTPHPSMDIIHYLGSRIGLFSRHANEEHEELLDYERLLSAGARAGLSLVFYKRFLLGGNQLAVFSK